MTEQDIQLKNAVMHRVKTVHYMRTVVRPFIIKVTLFAVALIATSVLVSIPDVIANISHSPAALSYFFSAFIHTRIIVQIILVVAALSFVLLARDIIKNFKYIHRPDFA